MNTKDIEQLIELLEKSSISEIEVGRWGKKIRVSRQSGNMVVQSSGFEKNDTTLPRPTSAEPVDVPVVEEGAPEQGAAIKSPMVGTFYRAPSPDVDAFVKVGDHVKMGDTLCIIEAMKIMNEVEAEISGVILDIKADNAQPVEYGQTLFLIEP
ncbi:MAG: acetyl-CoA carboxylase biotin carboxyl carrier protein [Candidatus Marinimicrobia bacterium]|nr:acetyl-CoA carboxylase biotin carboxyl carrier protein [Candidatus Neomarinimicrobiota bacterium]MCF7851245.1 acetyl-CoA carboxylase biotin carboxyl carrier protein [Candidatus Neomarinimicrobiota bacterium]MCF7905329.1 acetyl-CoA carboxylase biotin carboxyl carrier protein [Candidatus Neomarinimicrobiota bacterium]